MRDNVIDIIESVRREKKINVATTISDKESIRCRCGGNFYLSGKTGPDAPDIYPLIITIIHLHYLL